MESAQNSITMLYMFTHPVFLVKDGIVIGANQAARELQFKESTSVYDILLSGAEEYRNFTGGSLSLTVGTGPTSFIAAVVKANECDFFHLNCGSENSDLKALALASRHLRDPLTNVIALTDSLLLQRDVATEKEKMRIAQLDQNLHRLLRSVGNMSDAHNCSNQTIGMEQLNITAVISEAVQTVQQQCTAGKHEISFSTEGDSVAGLADRDLLERSAYNMLSNALRHSDADSSIAVTLRCSKKQVRFIVENQCKNISTELLGTIFFRYRRDPTVADGGKGLGLGIPIVQAVASAHKGSLMVTLPEPGKIRFCLTIPVVRDNSGTLRSPVLRPDYTGGYDRSLIELSDVLSCSAYKK